LGQRIESIGTARSAVRRLRAAGEDIIAFDNPTEVGEHEFDFEWGESGQWVWQHRDTKRYYDTAELAAFCIELLLDHSNRQ